MNYDIYICLKKEKVQFYSRKKRHNLKKWINKIENKDDVFDDTFEKFCNHLNLKVIHSIQNQGQKIVIYENDTYRLTEILSDYIVGSINDVEINKKYAISEKGKLYLLYLKEK